MGAKLNKNQINKQRRERERERERTNDMATLPLCSSPKPAMPLWPVIKNCPNRFWIYLELQITVTNSEIMGKRNSRTETKTEYRNINWKKKI